MFSELWLIAEKLISYISKAWDWLSQELAVKIPLKIPLLAPNGIDINLGISPLGLIGSSLLILLAFRLIKSLIPFT